MALPISKLPEFSSACQVKIPRQNESPKDFISRWSNTKLSLPALASSTEDILTALEYARHNSLKVVPAAGGHGSFVPIDDRALYLDIRRFDCIAIDEQAATVKLGGGVLTRDLLHALGEKGYYTSVPNSNAVGMVGFCLGGGSSPFNALIGLAIDNILNISIITASGRQLEIGPESRGDEESLFHVLCGAGLGFGVVTSITLRIFPIRALKMEDDQIWTRMLLFPPSQIAVAAELFTMLQHPEPKLTAVLVFMRAPPTAPQPGAPMLMVNISYFGPAEEAERAASAAFDDRFVSRAIMAKTGTQSIPTMNDAFDPLNRHGDFKEQYSAWCSSVTVETIVTAFQNWLSFGEGTPDARNTSFLVLAAKGTQAMLEHDLEGKKFFPRSLRGRSIFVQAVPWWTAEASEMSSRKWAEATMALFNAPQHRDARGTPESRDTAINAFASNLSKGIDLRTVYLPHQLNEIRRVKRLFDPTNLFWNPVVDGV